MEEINEYIKNRIKDEVEKITDTQDLVLLFDLVHQFCEERKSINE